MKDNRNLEIIKEKLSILDVVSTYLKLEKAGNQFRARCPFHNEKSPSFYVSPTRGTYHCFGCSEHGDIFSFTMKIEGLQFKDALKMLATKAGVSLNFQNREEDSHAFDVLENATHFFEENLKKNPEAIEYLKKRGLSGEVVKRFRIGFAPNDWRQLYNHLINLKFTDEDILSSGLCIKHEKGVYDRFRSRIMFPISNSSGKTVAFTGRIIGADEGKDGVAKYVNSPETSTYHKSSILFGYDKARLEIAKQKKVIVVEGQMDVVMTHMMGCTNTVAISGTAFTVEQLSILKRFADVVVLALDSDKAGYNAMLKSAELALSNDLEVEGIKLLEKDPADMIKTDPKTWEVAVKTSKPILTLIAEIISEKEKIKPRQIQAMRKELFPLLRSVKSPLLKRTYLTEIAKILDVPTNIIEEEVEMVKSEIEGQIKKEKKTPIKQDLLTVFAKGKVALAQVKNQILKNKYENLFEELKKYQSGYDIFDIPSNIFEREYHLVEQTLTDDESDNNKILIEAMVLAIRAYLEEVMNFSKNKIRDGVELEENLNLVQEMTKKLNLLKAELQFDK